MIIEKGYFLPTGNFLFWRAIRKENHFRKWRDGFGMRKKVQRRNWINFVSLWRENCRTADVFASRLREIAGCANGLLWQWHVGRKARGHHLPLDQSKRIRFNLLHHPHKFARSNSGAVRSMNYGRTPSAIGLGIIVARLLFIPEIFPGAYLQAHRVVCWPIKRQ